MDGGSGQDDGNWQIGESGTALALDPQGRGEVTFTVTDASTTADRAVLTVNPLDGAADGWFTVTEPMRPVAAGASVVFPAGVAVPLRGGRQLRRPGRRLLG